MSRILVIEDDPAQRRALHIALEKSGHVVVEAMDGRAGLAAFAANPADLVITDLIMPDVEGIETIREIRKQNPKVPIIAMSRGGCSSPEGYLRMAKIFGASEIMMKPIEISLLRAAVARLLGSGAPPAQANSEPGRKPE